MDDSRRSTQLAPSAAGRSPTRCAATSDPGCQLDPALGFDNYVQQLDASSSAPGCSARRSAACPTAASSRCATRRRDPERVSALVLVSAPAPGWVPIGAAAAVPGAAAGCRRPLFVLSAPARLWPEIRSGAAVLGGARSRFVAGHGAARRSPRRSCRRWRQRASPTAAGGSISPTTAARVQAPTLVVTGDDDSTASSRRA